MYKLSCDLCFFPPFCHSSIMMKFQFKEDKAIAAVLYVAKAIINHGQSVDFHKLFKILYFAELKHLSQWGRPITGDYFVAMSYGPVPSAIYDILKSVKGDNQYLRPERFSEYFNVHSHRIEPKREPDLDALSSTDVELLNESITENVYLRFDQLVSKSHDDAYSSAVKDGKISFKKMAEIAGADSEMIKYIRQNAENESVAR